MLEPSTERGVDDESDVQFLNYHFYICDKLEFLECTNHLLIEISKDETLRRRDMKRMRYEEDEI